MMESWRSFAAFWDESLVFKPVTRALKRVSCVLMRRHERQLLLFLLLFFIFFWKFKCLLDLFIFILHVWMFWIYIYILMYVNIYIYVCIYIIYERNKWHLSGLFHLAQRSPVSSLFFFLKWYISFFFVAALKHWGWKGSSVVKNTCCFRRGPVRGCQHSPGGYNHL